MTPINVTDEHFAKAISKGLVLVDFWAPWCGPCKMLTPVLEELSTELEGKASIVKVNVDDNPATAGAFEIMSIPTMILFKDGEPLGKISGFQPKEVLEEIINEYL